ncbi:MAG: 16S rRNA (cytosine(1402)-N(4))-methyltransferase RsmH [Erysipelotrichaceae bacterium]
MQHISVLLNECIENLNISPNKIYVDGTLGRAGHSSEILKKLDFGHLYAFDKDCQAIKESNERLLKISNNFTLINDDFSNMTNDLANLGISEVDGILLDLGVSSPQFDDPNRGFSYRFDAKLDMRMDQNQALSAYEVVNDYAYGDLVRIFFTYGEEKFSKQIARAIVKVRETNKIETTLQLVDVIKSALPSKVLNSKGHPAKQVFQAIRIEVNHELEALELVLEQAIKLLAPKGRLVVITFHSLEDRMVKNIFKEWCKDFDFDKKIPIKASDIKQSDYQLVNKKVILPTVEELEHNKRSHSAKLRVLERK